MPQKNERIVVGVDGSTLSMAALRWALAEAARRHAAVDVVHAWSYPMAAVTPYAGSTGPIISPEDVESAATHVVTSTMAEVADEVGALDVTSSLERGHPAEVLARKAKGSAMVVVGSRGHGGFVGMLLGSTSRQLLHHASVPVVVVNDETANAGGRVVVGVDGSPPSIEALRWAVTEARLRQVGLDVVHAWQHPGVLFFGETMVIGADDVAKGAQEVLDRSMAAVADEVAGIDVRATVERGHPVGVLTARGDAGLLVVGSRGRGGFTGLLLGSVSSETVHHAPCPAVVVRTGD
jgi:nucleotide-binding universal stress UspA family protein